MSVPPHFLSPCSAELIYSLPVGDKRAVSARTGRNECTDLVVRSRAAEHLGEVSRRESGVSVLSEY